MIIQKYNNKYIARAYLHGQKFYFEGNSIMEAISNALFHFSSIEYKRL